MTDRHLSIAEPTGDAPAPRVWEEVPERPPELPEALAVPTGRRGAWYRADAVDGAELFAYVQGDGGRLGPYMLSLFVVSGRGAEPRYPMLDEVWSAVNELSGDGSMFMLPPVVSGHEVPTPQGGTALYFAQAGAAQGSVAETRWNLAGGGGSHAH